MASPGKKLAAVKPGAPEESGVYVETKNGRMPPKEKLSDTDVNAIGEWIRQGAKDN